MKIKNAISRELFKEVMGIDITASFGLVGEDIVFNHWEKDGVNFMTKQQQKYNIHSVAHKCKKWVDKNKWVSVRSEYLRGGKGTCTLIEYTSYDDPIKKEFDADTEPEAIFKACEWVLKESK